MKQSFRVIALASLLVIAGCRTAAVPPAAKSTPAVFNCVKPGIVQTLKVESFREIGLYLPPCYDPVAASLYPVLYLLPGFGGTHMEWIDSGIAPLTDGLIQSREIPPLLIVTTDNTYDAIQADDIIKILVPYIESHYRADPDRTHRAIAGGSLGGASAYTLTFQYPEVFSSAGIFGNGLITGLEDQYEAWLKSIPAGIKPRVFLNSGEQDTYMLKQAKLLIPYLDKYGLEHTEIFSPGGHATAYWLSNFPAYYHWLAEDWKQ